jgi:transcriptional regulator with XRE-family HTH domain
MPPKMTAAHVLRELRKGQGRSLRVAAGDLGLAPSHLSRIERGQRGMGVELGERVANYYGVSSEMISLSEGRLPQDLAEILLSHPEEIDRLRAQFGRDEPRDDDS